VVAYNGYTKAAKRNAVISNFNTALRYLKQEMMKCDIDAGPIRFMTLDHGLKDWECSEVNSNQWTLLNFITDGYRNHLNYGFGMTNPYGGDIDGRGDPGQIQIWTNTGWIYLGTRYYDKNGDIQILEDKKVNSTPYKIP